MKKSICALFVTLFALTLVACGDNVSATATPEVSEEVETTEYKEFDGEGEGQGVIKSDDELEALNEEAEQYSSGEDYDTNVIESKEEVAKEETTEYEKPWYGPLGTSDFKAENFPYCPSGNFFVSEDQFDLVGYINANGGYLSYRDHMGEKQEQENEETAMYLCRFVYPSGTWQIYIGAANGIEISKERSDEDEGIMCLSSKEGGAVYLNQYGKCAAYSDLIDALDYSVKRIKDCPNDEFVPGQNGTWIE